MLKIEKLFGGLMIVAPIIIGAYLSGTLKLAEQFAIPLTVFQIALFGGFFFFFLKKIILRDLEIEVYGLEKWYLLFFLIIYFSILYTPEREQALFYSIRLAVLLSMTYLIYNAVNKREEIIKLCYIIIGVSVIISFFNIIQAYFNPEVFAWNYLNQGNKLIRQGGNESDPNIFASNFIIPIMLLVSFFGYAEKKIWKIVLFGLAAILLGSVLLSYSRSSWVAIAVGIMLILIMQKKYTFLLYSFIGFIVLFFSSSMVREFSYSLFERLIDIFAGSEDDSSRYRIIIAVTAIRMFFDTYFIGVGFQGFSTAFKDYYPPDRTIGVYEPHNDFYMIFAELGIIGFGIFLTIMGLIYLAAKNNMKLPEKGDVMRPISLGFFASFISYIIFSQFISLLLFSSLFMICVGLIFAIKKIMEMESIGPSSLNGPQSVTEL